MMSKKYDSLWSLMETYNFTSTKIVDPDLVCTICEGIVRNAHKSLCSCVFCYDCFERYSLGSVNYCPGRIKNCSQSIENVNEYLQSDESKNKRILNIVVKCPLKSCDFQGVLSTMESHILTHNDDINKDEILNDGKIDKLITSIEYLKHEIANLLKDSNKKSKLISEIRREIDALKETNYSAQQQRENIENEFNANKIELEALKETNYSMKEEIGNLQKELIINKCQLATFQESFGKFTVENNNNINKNTNEAVKCDEIICGEKTNNNKLSKGFESVQKPACSNLPRKFDKTTNCSRIPQNSNKKLLESSSSSSSTTMSDRKYGQSNSTKDIKKSKSETKSENLNVIMIENSDRSIATRSVVMTNEKVSFNPPNGNSNAFHWKVYLEGNLKNPAGIKEPIISKSFYSAEIGYKMKLVIQPNERYLSVGFVIIDGQFDRYLRWPMRQNVNICLVDYRAENTILSVDLNPFDDFSIFKQPDWNEWNTPYIVENFIKLNSIYNNGQLYKNNSFIIRCVVDDSF